MGLPNPFPLALPAEVKRSPNVPSNTLRGLQKALPHVDHRSRGMYPCFVSLHEATTENSHYRLESSLIPRVSKRSLSDSLTRGAGSDLSRLLELAYYSNPYGLELLKKTATNQ